MSTQTEKPPETSSLKRLHHIHHMAFRCRDAEQTRWFYEDVLGFPLAAAVSLDTVPGLGDEVPYLHLFFELGDGNFIAFFDAPDNVNVEFLERKHSFDLHMAFEAESEEKMIAWQKHINDCGKSCLGPVDHGFVKSVYMYDPNGIQVEITCKASQYEEIMQQEHEHAREQIREWCERTREQKIQLFGAEAIDKRGHNN